MSVTLTTEHGEFHAETEEEAFKAARAAKRQAARDEKRREAAHATARDRAMVDGFRVYDRLAQGKSPPGAWCLARPGSKWFPPQKHEDYCYEATAMDCEGGRASLKLHDTSWTVVGTVENGAGFTFLVFIQCRQAGNVEPHAVATCDGEVAIVRMHGITMDQFREFQA